MEPVETVQPIRGPLPPVFLLIALLLEIGLRFAIPVAFIIPRPWHWIGIAVITAGLIVAALAAGQFTRVDTPVRPSETPTALVTAGLFRVTRNPMYLGMVAVLLGTAVLTRALAPFIVPVTFVWLITVRFIRPEERNLRLLFGDQYTDYAQRVHRWL